MNYISPFKRINVTNEGAKAIGTIQNEFDALWNKLRKLAPNTPEKFKALQSLQESCMFMCRSTALKHVKLEEQQKQKQSNKTKELEEQPIPSHATKEPEFKNGPKIVYKKKPKLQREKKPE